MTSTQTTLDSLQRDLSATYQGVTQRVPTFYSDVKAAGAVAVFESNYSQYPGVNKIFGSPRNAALPAAVGSVYLDRETGAVVRLSMTFTRAAIIDKRIETLVVTLENGLVRERYWLPRRQEVEVSRGSTWFDIPARGIVRGRWEISGYTVNERLPQGTMLLPRLPSRVCSQLA